MSNKEIIYFQLRSNCKYSGSLMQWSRSNGGNKREIFDNKQQCFELIDNKCFTVPEECIDYVKNSEIKCNKLIKDNFYYIFDFLKKYVKVRNIILTPSIYIDIFSKVVQCNLTKKIQNYTNYYFSIEATFKDGIREIIMIDSRDFIELDLIKSYLINKLNELIVLKAFPKYNLSPGTYDLLFTKEVSGSIAHEIIGHLSEADTINEHNLWNIGSKICSEQLTVIDDPTIPGLVASYGFDDEGTVAQKTILIEKGIIENELNNCINHSTKLNGHGRCTSYKSMPIVRMSNTYIKPGNTKENKIYNDFANGIIINKFHKGGLDYFSGNCILKCDGKVVADGKMIGVVEDIIVYDNISQLFFKVDSVGDKFDWSNGCWCRKKDILPLPVKYGGPVIKLNRVNIITKYNR